MYHQTWKLEGVLLSFQILYSWTCLLHPRSAICFPSRRFHHFQLISWPSMTHLLTVLSVSCFIQAVNECGKLQPYSILTTPILLLLFVRRVLTPYFSEDVLFSIFGLEQQNEDGVSILFYLQKIFPGFTFLSFFHMAL